MTTAHGSCARLDDTDSSLYTHGTVKRWTNLALATADASVGRPALRDHREKLISVTQKDEFVPPAHDTPGLVLVQSTGSDPRVSILAC